MIDAVRAAVGDQQGWLVGGAVRDELLGRPTPDLDVVVARDPAAVAERLRRGAGAAAAFELSGTFGGWRVVGPQGAWQVDVLRLQGGSLEADLAARDLTINAMARPLAGGALVDPHGGRTDLQAHRLRMVASGAFEADPLRVVRVARLAVELGFEVDAPTLAVARAGAPGLARVAGERVFAELRRIVVHDEVVRGLALLDELAATAVVLPELEALRGIEQSRYHHRDVHGHTLEVLEQVVALQRDPGAALGLDLAEPIAALLGEPLADELTRGDALRLGALLHDVAKPRTRTENEGRVSFPGHDALGSEMTRAVLTRLRTSERLRAHLAALTLHHLRLGFLVHQAPLDRRAIHRYLVACAPVAVDVSLLSVADRLATRGHKSEEAIARHLALARTLLGEALAQRAAPDRTPLVRGDELARELALLPGPELGRLLAEIDEARFAGEVGTREQALALARRLVRGG